MNNATNNTISAIPGWGRLIVQDIGNGIMATSRLVVTLAGCFSLIAGAAVVADPHARETVTRHVTEFSASLFAQAAEPVIAEAQADEFVTVVRPPEPAQRHVTQYLSRRYRVADGAIRPVVAEAYEQARTHGLEPLLILAVMAIESSMNPFAESTVGAQGLMQVMTRVHAEKFEEHGGEHAALDPIANVKVGSAILKDLISRGGSIERGLQLYVGAGNLPDDRGYAARVLGELGRLRMAASGKVEAALAAGWRTAQEQAAPKTAPAAKPSDA
ncbi:MAG TPA: transglycosylase SLT domain-containing protein [Burkholderiaceae bacterium]|nr:transglycosylase SLT domain-containing protein [Burkholderiaceae bacterium]